MRSRITRSLSSVLLTLCAATIAVSAQSAPEMVTDRPDATESAMIVPTGWFQFENGLTIGVEEDGVTTSAALAAPDVLMRVGVLEGIEVRVGAGFESHTTRIDDDVNDIDTSTTVSGMSPISIGAKFKLGRERGALPELAVIATATLPAGADEFAPSRIVPELRLTASHELSDVLGLAYNLGGYLDDQNNAVGLYTLSASLGITEDLGSFVEVFGVVGAGMSPSHTADAGFTYSVLTNLQFDISTGTALSEAADDYFLNVGVSFRLPR